MSCHGKYPGKLKDCIKCQVIGSCITKWNKENPTKHKLLRKDIEFVEETIKKKISRKYMMRYKK